MEQWSEVRREVLTAKLSKRAACKKYELRWDTLKKILEHAEPPGYQRQEPRKKPVLGPFVELIHELLEADKQAPPKQRHMAERILERLREQGYQGGRTVVQEEVRRWHKRQAEVFMPLVHRPGEAQADFGEAVVVYRGQECKVAMFVMSLPFSDALFCQIFPWECTETFQEGHRRAFEFFSGVPSRITSDNSRIAVTKVIQKRGGAVTREFLRLESHYLFAHHFCRVRRPMEKGHTENLVGYGRRNYLVPVPRIDDFERFNEGLVEACRQDLTRQLRGKDGTKAELLEEVRWPRPQRRKNDVFRSPPVLGHRTPSAIGGCLHGTIPSDALRTPTVAKPCSERSSIANIRRFCTAVAPCGKSRPSPGTCSSWPRDIDVFQKVQPSESLAYFPVRSHDQPVPRHTFQPAFTFRTM